MTWNVGGYLVLTVLATDNISSSSKQFSARFCSSGDTSCVEFTIHNVTRRESGPVICSLQGEYGSKTAQLYVQDSAVSEQFQLEPLHSTVLQGSDVQFKATVQGILQVMTWNVGGYLVLTVLATGNISSSSKQFSARFCSSGDTSSVEFTIHNVTRRESGPVICSVQGEYGSKTAQLYVQVPKPPDWTVLIALVVSIGGFALLVLLILGIIFCYKRRKEKQPNYQDEMRRVRTQISVVDAAGQRQGQANAGYVPEGQTSVELSDSGFFQANGSNILEMPDVVNSNQVGNDYSSAYNTVDKSGFRKHRHATIV
ncbi:immunoglobulin superfamily member 5 isoform X2 [Siniperca chuatsi]|uniref:immunoglobulin superfamily member 5 isoform X2 n=1 Tax=Siniperca chuatsi TaxID=119488 RepID=UPI001CE0F041|nr:immunoglobulin superfamily member 5 isoform X2 [Siniperca chuatsi]